MSHQGERQSEMALRAPPGGGAFVPLMRFVEVAHDFRPARQDVAEQRLTIG
jgi:hypothetical protein